jgi:VWFA-related protein
MKTLAAAVLLLLTAGGSAQTPPAQEQQPPATFRSSVDLVPVDVNVVDKDGRPVSDLTAADFSLTVDGRPRKIASAEFIGVSRLEQPAPARPTNYSSNAAAAGGRLILLLVDQGSLAAGRGRTAIEAAVRFVGRLRPSDRVGLATIPGAGPHIDFTASHAIVQTMLKNIIGLAAADHSPRRVGITEALAFERSNEQIIQTLVERECAAYSTPEELASCRAQLAGDARILFAEVKSRTRDALLSLRNAMERLAKTPEPKTVVFVSEGIYLDRDTSDLNWLAPTAARGRITLYVLQLEPPSFDASGARVSPTRNADIDLAQDGLNLIAGLARGSVFRIATTADFAFNRLALELSGYYLLSFEPETGDRDGKPHKIRIGVPRRRGIEVRSRQEFAVDAPRTRSTDDLLVESLRSPLLASEIGVKTIAYSFKDPESPKLRILIATEIDRSTNPGAKIALAYALINSKGDLVLSQVERDVSSPIGPARTQSYVAAVDADPGVYTLKLAVVDDRGKRGSVEHSFRAQLTAAGQVRLTDLLLGETSAGTGIAPAVTADFTGETLHGYFELLSEAVDPLTSATAVIEVAASEQGRALDSAPATLHAGGPNRVMAEAEVPIGLLPQGDYVARAVISAGGRKIGQVTSPFRIVRSAPIAAAGESSRRAPGAGAPIAFTSRIEAFERASVLAPPVVGFFIDRMNVGNRAAMPPAAVDAARTGRFDAALEALKGTTAPPVASAFIGGLALYARGDLEAAAGRFRETLRIDSEFFPAAFYLGACYAAGGHDRDAAGAWQTSLITQSEAPFIYTLLGDALARLQDTNAALVILSEASQLWPDDDQVRMRLGVAQAAADKPADAVRTLDPYLSRHPADHERLLVALRAIYLARSTGGSIWTAEEDRQHFERYAAAYAAARGPQQALVDQWKKFIVR